ncbi:MAG: hypothetical protein JXA42_16285 [Anaerolineales bacterium]|nr:hypothetical protein [Anaerolineales bacterium]
MHKEIFLRYTGWLILLLPLVLLISCESDRVYGDQVVLDGDVYLVCSKECKLHGSCGTMENSKKVVLLGEEPAFLGVSDVTFVGVKDGSGVNIVETRVVSGVEQNTNQPVEIRFYSVEEGDGTSGWVPGFCISSTE